MRFFYNAHKIIAYRQTPLPAVCSAFYPHTNLCLSVPVAAYDHLSVRPSLYPRVTVFVLISACHRLFVLVSVYDLSVRPCIRMSPSVFASAYDRLSVRPCIRMLPFVSVCISIWFSLSPFIRMLPSVYPRVLIWLSLRPCIRMLLSVYPCIRMWLSLRPCTACYRLFAFVSACDRLSVRPSFRILPRWIWHFWAQWKKTFGDPMYAWVSTYNADRLRNIFVCLT